MLNNSVVVKNCVGLDHNKLNYVQTSDSSDYNPMTLEEDTLTHDTIFTNREYDLNANAIFVETGSNAGQTTEQPSRDLTDRDEFLNLRKEEFNNQLMFIRHSM